MRTNKIKYIPVAVAAIWQIFWIYIYAWTDFENTYGNPLFLAVLILGSVAIVQSIYFYKKVSATLSNQASVVIIAAIVYGVSYFLYAQLSVLHALLNA
jgi:hypothetical protein